MADLVPTLNNRELATLFWLTSLLVWALTRRQVRDSVTRLLKAFLARKVVSIVLLMLLYITSTVLVLARVKLWTVGLTKDTITWTVGVAFVLLFNITKATQDDGFFPKIIVGNFKLTIFVEFLTNLYVFPFWVEFVLFPVVLLFVLLHAVAETDLRYSVVQKALAWPIAFYGLAVLGFSIYSAVTDYRSLLNWDELRSFLLPILLTLALVPFIYLLALYAEYEVTFLRLRFFNDDPQIVRLGRRAILRRFNFRLSALSRWSRTGQVHKLSRVTGEADIGTLFDTPADEASGPEE